MIIPHQSGVDLEFQARGVEVLKKKKIQISIHIVLTNFQPRSIHKIIVLNTLRYNHLLIKTQKKKKTQNNIIS